MRYFVSRNSGVVVDKQAFSGDNSSIDFLISLYKSLNPTYIVTESDLATFDGTILILNHGPLRTQAILGLDSFDPISKVQRAVVLLLIDRFNVLHQRFNDLAVDVAAAASLADLKTRWATHPNLPTLDISQVKPAIQTKISSGVAD